MIDLGLDWTVLLLRVSSPRIASATFGGLSGILAATPETSKPCDKSSEVVQSAQEPLSPRLATGYSLGGCTTTESTTHAEHGGSQTTARPVEAGEVTAGN